MIHLFAGMAGLALLIAGAEAVVRGGGSIGRRLGLSPLVVGLTIVAYGTSTPELMVSTHATLEGHDDVALANVVGSNICNILLILGVCAWIRPMAVNSRVLRLEAPMLVGITAAVSLLLLADELGRMSGVILLALLMGYTVWTIREARRESSEAGLEPEEDLSSEPRLWIATAFTIGGLFMLFGGASLLIDGAVGGADALGVPQSVVGLTVVAVGTSLPELITSVIAALRGESDLAIGNVLGSNAFNLTGVLGAAAAIDPVAADGLVATDLAVMFAASVVLFGFLYTGRRLDRWEGVLLLTAYVAYVASLAPMHV